MTDKSYYSEIGGDVKGLIGDGEFKGIAGDISGGVINQYIITQKSGVEIQAQTLITGSPYSGKRLSEIQTKLCLAWFIARDTVPHTTAHRYNDILNLN